MPIYEYGCRSCGSRFQDMRAMARRQEAPPCPTCDGDDTGLLLSTPGMVGAAVAEGPVPGCEVDGGSCCGGACFEA